MFGLGHLDSELSVELRNAIYAYLYGRAWTSEPANQRGLCHCSGPLRDTLNRSEPIGAHAATKPLLNITGITLHALKPFDTPLRDSTRDMRQFAGMAELSYCSRS
jgi:hypothetical protein